MFLEIQLMVISVVTIIVVFCTFISPKYTFYLAGHIIVYTPSQGKNRENYFHH